MPSTRHCILISQLLSLYISKSSTAFYVHRVLNITWAGPSTLAQQEKASLHRDEENIRIVTKRTSVATSNTTPSAQLQGCHQEGGGFLPRRRAFLHPTSFFYRAGVFIIFPDKTTLCSSAKLSMAGPVAGHHLPVQLRYGAVHRSTALSYQA